MQTAEHGDPPQLVRFLGCYVHHVLMSFKLGICTLLSSTQCIARKAGASEVHPCNIRSVFAPVRSRFLLAWKVTLARAQ